jgi:hypothetical protein
MVSILSLIATKIFIQSIKWMDIQEIFQSMFKLISVIRQVLYWRRQAIEHTNTRIKCSLLVCWQVGYWLMQVRFSSSINIVYLRVYVEIIPIINQKSRSDSIYWECNGSIFNFLKCSLHESLPLIPTMILIILFCNLKIILL